MIHPLHTFYTLFLISNTDFSVGVLTCLRASFIPPRRLVATILEYFPPPLPTSVSYWIKQILCTVTDWSNTNELIYTISLTLEGGESLYRLCRISMNSSSKRYIWQLKRKKLKNLIWHLSLLKDDLIWQLKPKQS